MSEDKFQPRVVRLSPCVKAVALAALAFCFAHPVAAQSTVTIYGLMDTAVGKLDGTTKKTLGTGATSRLGFRGSEDLGGGLKAIFQLETQINPDDGTQYNAAAFWSGRSTVGLEGALGRITLGREVNASHYVEAAADPFGQDGLPAGYGARGGISQNNGGPGQIDTVRTNNSVNYAYTLAGFTFRAQGAFREGNDPLGNRPYSFSLIYANGPLQLGISTINPSKINDNWSYVSAVYDFGAARLSGGYGQGKNTFNQEMKNGLVGVLVPVGPAQIKSSFSQTSADGTTIQQKLAIGVYYFLSKRTVVYTDLTYDWKAGYVYGLKGWTLSPLNVPGNGFDMGLRHYF